MRSMYLLPQFVLQALNLRLQGVNLKHVFAFLLFHDGLGQSALIPADQCIADGDKDKCDDKVGLADYF